MNFNSADARKWPEPVEPNCGLTDSFEQALKFAFEMHNAGRHQEAETMCRALLPVRPKNAQLLFLLGMILHQARRDEEAVRWLSLAAQCQPKSARIFNGLGCVCQNLKDHARAASAFERAMELEPPSAATCYNLGNTCYRLEQIERAAALFRRAVEINRHDSASWNNLGKCLKELNRLDESIAAYNRAVEIAPDYALARYGRAVSLLAAGRLTEGFREYEWRWHLTKRRKFPQPAWRGGHASGQTLLLHAEQGFGDAIQMLRFIPAARERVARVILECRPELTTLFQYSNCADAVIPYGSPIPPFDCVTSLLSLPHALGVTLDAIPNRTPYLQAPPGKQLPPAPSGHLKVGLAWAGNPGHHQDAARSIRLQELAPVLQVPGVSFYSLQQSVPARDECCLRSKSDIINFRLIRGDFLDTASVIAELDLVITVDTAVAHLAGALGKPVWLLVQHSPDWRWFLDRPDTPWYPTMQLYRQAERGRWDLPVKRVAEALRRRLDSRSARPQPPLVKPFHLPADLTELRASQCGQSILAG
jgi:tetratricopeptide (TPR) repeat protein